MNGDAAPVITCDQPPGNQFADRLENELSRHGVEAVLIEFRAFPEGEFKEIEEILADDSSINRLREVLRKMEQLTVPVIALVPEPLSLLQFEIALACHARFTRSQEINLNFSWNKYGLMPVLGGTQRLPRLVGIEFASRLLLQGESLTFAQLTSSGLLHMTSGELRTVAMQWAANNRGYNQPWDRVLKEVDPIYSQSPGNRSVLEKIYLRLRQKVTPEEAAPTAILRSIQEGLERSFDAGLRLEAELWSSVRVSRSTKNRVKIFGVTRPRARSRQVAGRTPFKRVGILGAGLMGTGIASAAARSGCHVVLVDISQRALDRALERIRKLAERESAIGTNARFAPGSFSLIDPSTSIKAFAECEFVVEAIFERPDLKKAALHEISAVVDSATVLASNTTTLPISDLAKAVEKPERFLGTHFFAPADRMELLEIITGETTSDETVNRALLVASMLGKTPVVVRDGPGFFTSRVVMAYIQEALLMLGEGASPWLIDNVAQNAGMVLGPLTVADLTSLDLLANIFESLATHGRGMAREASKAVEILKQFTARSRLGRKARAGIYDYDSNDDRVDWAGLKHLFGASEHSPVEIEQRLFVSQTIEATHALSEGIIDDPAMADLASVLGWSYPAARGGVLSYIEFLGRDTFSRTCQELQRKFGDRFNAQ
jgi:3-hydroxyacyl-CoA dehydrogenase / enoyl-CoA hydratase / 3-hydroxybutyryl-CoA epimerase